MPSSGQVIVDEAVPAIGIVGNPLIEVERFGVPRGLSHELVDHGVLENSFRSQTDANHIVIVFARIKHILQNAIVVTLNDFERRFQPNSDDWMRHTFREHRRSCEAYTRWMADPNSPPNGWIEGKVRTSDLILIVFPEFRDNFQCLVNLKKVWVTVGTEVTKALARSLVQKPGSFSKSHPCITLAMVITSHWTMIDSFLIKTCHSPNCLRISSD